MYWHFNHTYQFPIVFCIALLISACGNGNAPVADGTTIPAPNNNAPLANIDSVTPREAGPGEIITVQGENFGDIQGAKILDINGIPAINIINWTDTEIVAMVPVGVSTGNVSIIDKMITGTTVFLVVPWLLDSTENASIGSLPMPQQNPQLVTDGEHGAIITWSDGRNTWPVSYIYAQRVNSNGQTLWSASDGVRVNTAMGDQVLPQIVSDDAGGAIIVWQDRQNDNGDIYAQRIDSSGAIQWGESGVAISVATNIQFEPQIVSDGSGGAIIVWSDARNIPEGEPLHLEDSDWNIYAQRINHSGEVQWVENGVEVTTAGALQQRPRMVSDGAGGAIITWDDQRVVDYSADIYAQRINSTGSPEWTVDGVAITVQTGAVQIIPRMVSDGSGGAIIAWSGSNGILVDPYGNLYAQRVNGSGMLQWSASGVVISKAPDSQSLPDMVMDGEGGAIITWTDKRDKDMNDKDIYVQRVNSDGDAQWLTDGVAVSVIAGSQSASKIMSDNAGGATIIWQDDRNGKIDIYAQRVDSAGVMQWTSNGIAVSTAGDDYTLEGIPEKTALQGVPDGVGGVITVWEDLRDISGWDIHAQGITFGGRL